MKKGLPAQLFPLACLGIVLHADVVGVEFMARDVGEELREVQPPQELHRVRVGAVTHAAGGEPVVKWEGEGQRQGENRPGGKMGTIGPTAGDSHGATAAPAEGSPD